MAIEVKTHRELHGKEPEPGYEWDAGNTPPRDKEPGRWMVRRDRDNWVVLFHFSNGRPENIISTFPPTEDGERAAKIMALKLVDVAWGRYKDDA